ncbi:PLAC8-domain-containing protein [Karstenula rhodostoma CBS 690.94]|uniref:PLAC8-domain-containing protein n=1 Tax=Karstenula rhodostoma CBS 690.94 TaxID=1392251 RepID=A0A9P4P8U8_9PLEO|nr:PLAC8-domain-containing protein [Karstenula rhodostoma CBS 690.94]
MTTIQKQDWHHSGSGCCSPMGTCCLSWWCPCMQYGKTRHRSKNDGNMQGYSCCNSSCMAFCGLACLGISFILPMMNRSDIRAKYHLKGNGCGDCLCACCCTPCDLTQQEKEVSYREESKHLLQPQPGKNEGMYYAQQPQQQPHYHH